MTLYNFFLIIKESPWASIVFLAEILTSSKNVPVSYRKFPLLKCCKNLLKHFCMSMPDWLIIVKMSMG